MPTKIISGGLLALFLLLAAQCRGAAPAGEEPAAAGLAPAALAKGEKLQVVATTSIVADIVHQVGGELIDLAPLLPLGTDPHTFEPTPRDLARVADAHVVFANGVGLEGFLDEMLANTGGKTATVYLSQGVELRHIQEGEEHQHEGEAHQHEGDDPHTWTSPANALIFVGNVEQALSTLDPANAERYAANAQAYQARLETLDAWVKEQIETIPPENREMVTDHMAFGYYADRYGLEQIGAVIPSFSTAAEPSAKELAELEDAIREYEVKAIFVGTSVNPTLAERVAQDTGVRLLPLYTGSLGEEGSGVESYLDYIRYNTNTIVEGLK